MVDIRKEKDIIALSVLIAAILFYITYSLGSGAQLVERVYGGTSTTTPTLTVTIGSTLTFTTTTDNFGTLTPSTPKFATTTLSVTTNNTSGWNVILSGDNQGSGSASTTMYLDTNQYTTGITDDTEWIPASATTSAGNATSVTSGDDILAFRVMSASGSTPFRSTSWWGTSDTNFNASQLWAGVASSTVYRQIGNAGSGSYQAAAHLSTVQYYLDVPTTQQSGAYSGPLTFSAAVNP